MFNYLMRFKVSCVMPRYNAMCLTKFFVLHQANINNEL